MSLAKASPGSPDSVEARRSSSRASLRKRAAHANGNQSDNSAPDSGAAYVFTGLGVGPSLALAPDGSGGYFIRCAGHAGLSYELLRAADLSGPWSSIATNTAPPSGLLEFHDSTPLSGQAFYRTVQP